MRSSWFGGLGAAVLAAATIMSPASAAEEEISECIDAVGTYLTTNVRSASDANQIVSRSLLSLTNGGHAFFTDSGEAGEPGYQPFSDGRGAWRCLSSEGGRDSFSAIILDFTFGSAGDRDQQIARLDLQASFDAASQRLEGKVTLSFVPLAGDPFDPDALSDQTAFTFTGRKLEAP
jgi:hypothetical protein